MPARMRRAGSLTAASTTLGVAAHVLAGGHAPNLWITLLAAGVILAASYALAGREHRLPAIFVGLLAGQAWIHLSSQLAGAGHSAHGAGGPSVAQWSPAVMVAAHVCASMITAAWLRLAEERVFRMARSLAMRILMLALVGLRGIRIASVGPAIPRLPAAEALPECRHVFPVMGMRAPPTVPGSIAVA